MQVDISVTNSYSMNFSYICSDCAKHVTFLEKKILSICFPLFSLLFLLEKTPHSQEAHIKHEKLETIRAPLLSQAPQALEYPGSAK